MKEGSSRLSNDSVPITWTAKHLYLPVSSAAFAGFKKQEDKQHLRDATLVQSWNAFSVEDCRVDVPECDFFEAAKLPLLHRKCCAEHTKLKRAFEYTMDVAAAANLPIFLDSGTLLSAVRDGYSTLVPWETDIDLGIVGVDPRLVAEPFAQFRKDRRGRSNSGTANRKKRQRDHLFTPCLTKVSKNASRHGRCKDAHYVYYAESPSEAEHDTSRVEIWPFWPEPGLLLHPTRKRLSVRPELVLPLVKCRFWGRECWCPGNASGYLDHEYGADGSWRRPKTIHWGQNNVHALKEHFTTRPPRPGDP